MVSEQLQGSADTVPINNAAIARAMLEVADLLETQQVNPFRGKAYRGAAQTLVNLRNPEILSCESKNHQLLSCWIFTANIDNWRVSGSWS